MTRIETVGLILDLDDTLYLERDYVRSGFAAVGKHVEQQFGIADFGERCWALFENGVRGRTFDQVRGETGLGDSVDTAALVDVYRGHSPSIRLTPDVEDFLERWPPDRPLGLISDGPVASQSAKIAALELHRRLDPIILSDSFGIEFRKPHDRPFLEVERTLGLPPHDLTYIADNPAKDFETPRRRGWHTIRIRRPLGEHSSRENPAGGEADAEITSFDELTW